MKPRSNYLIPLWPFLLAFCLVSGISVSSAQTIMTCSDLHKLSAEYFNYADKLRKEYVDILHRLDHLERKKSKNRPVSDTVGNVKSLETHIAYLAIIDSASLQMPLVYNSTLDTVNTGLFFLKSNVPESFSSCPEFKSLDAGLKKLQQELAVSETVNRYLCNQADLSNFAPIRKQVYYYQQQLKEYRSFFSDESRLQKKLLVAIREIPTFNKYFLENSYFAQLYPSTTAGDNMAALAGLQTRAKVQQILNPRLGIPTGSDVIQNPLQHLADGAQEQLNSIRKKNSESGNSDGEPNMPDGFKTNPQRTKTFLQRIEYGFDVQSQRGTRFLPAITDIGVSVGYKFSGKMIAGLGGSYKLGWGSFFDRVRLSHEGAGLRSYLDLRAKGSLWVTGGFEYNYLQSFSKFSDIINPVMWQKSGLVGLTKRYRIGKKQGKMQLLWDFLSYSQTPRSQAITFRFGYTL